MTNAHEGAVVEPGKNQCKKSYYLQFRATISTFERDSFFNTCTQIARNMLPKRTIAIQLYNSQI